CYRAGRRIGSGQMNGPGHRSVEADMARRLWAALAAAGLLIAAGGRADEAAKDLEKMQGTWRLVSGERNGEKLPEDQVKGIVRTFHGDAFEAKRGDRTVSKGKVKLDPSAKPKAVEVIITGQDGQEVTIKGIYEIDGDMMKTCLAQPGQDRP